MHSFDRKTFIQAVYDVVMCIPYGRATSYGAIAKAIGYPNRSRMVGNAMKACEKYTEKLPAHRVVNSQGILSGKDGFNLPDQMQHLVESENIRIENNRIKNWKQVFWDPIIELF